MNRLLIMILFLSSFFMSCSQIVDTKKQGESRKNDNLKPANLSFDTIETLVFKTGNGWGYNIIINKKIYIHQSHIPAINELKAFKTSEDAKKVAEYAVQKLTLTHKLPSLSYYELDSLNVL